MPNSTYKPKKFSKLGMSVERSTHSKNRGKLSTLRNPCLATSLIQVYYDDSKSVKWGFGTKMERRHSLVCR